MWMSHLIDCNSQLGQFLEEWIHSLLLATEGRTAATLYPPVCLSGKGNDRKTHPRETQGQ